MLGGHGMVLHKGHTVGLQMGPSTHCASHPRYLHIVSFDETAPLPCAMLFCVLSVPLGSFTLTTFTVTAWHPEDGSLSLQGANSHPLMCPCTPAQHCYLMRTDRHSSSAASTGQLSSTWRCAADSPLLLCMTAHHSFSNRAPFIESALHCRLRHFAGPCTSSPEVVAPFYS